MVDVAIDDAPIDDQLRAGHMPSLFRCEEANRGRDIFGSREITHGAHRLYFCDSVFKRHSE